MTLADRSAIDLCPALRPASRPALPWPYAALLAVEVCVLASLAASSLGRPPMSHLAGWLGVGSMLTALPYSLRRRVRALGRWGALPGWLDFHVFAGLQGYLLVAYHSAGAPLSTSLAAMSFLVVTLIVVSGLAGRYGVPRLAVAREQHAQASAATPQDERLARRLGHLEVAERWLSRWGLLHRPASLLLLALTTLHVLAHYAYAA